MNACKDTVSVRKELKRSFVENFLFFFFEFYVAYFHKQTEETLIRQLLQELPDLGPLCLQNH